MYVAADKVPGSSSSSSATNTMSRQFMNPLYDYEDEEGMHVHPLIRAHPMGAMPVNGVAPLHVLSPTPPLPTEPYTGGINTSPGDATVVANPSAKP